MDLNVLLWILGGGFTGTWGLCIFFMARTDSAMTVMRSEIRTDISEIRKEISELHKCVKDHHSRLCLVEHELEMD
jgi:hypothetical protein